MMNQQQNKHLIALHSLQQDGELAISDIFNEDQEEIFEIETKLIKTIKTVFKAINKPL